MRAAEYHGLSPALLYAGVTYKARRAVASSPIVVAPRYRRERGECVSRGPLPPKQPGL